jgi:hypothetical protein
MSGADAIKRGFADTLLAADQTERDEKTKASNRERGAVTALEVKLLVGSDTRALCRSRMAVRRRAAGAARVRRGRDW